MLKVSANQLPKDHQYNGMDLFKFICAFLVLIIHIQPFSGDFLWVKNFNFGLKNCLCRIAVPFYFTASGFLLFRKMDFANLENERIKKYCFKIFRLLGIWSFLLFVGSKVQLWYLGALVFAVIILKLLIDSKIKLRIIVIISAIAFIIGLLGDSYYGIIAPLKNYFITKVLIVLYDEIFYTTRNGLFFGLIFVLMGALFAQRKIVINNTVAFFGLATSMIIMFFEVYLIRWFSHPKDYNMFASLIPVVFFVFYIATHLNLKNRPIYSRLRNIGMLVFFLHLFVKYFVMLALEMIKIKTGTDLFAFSFFLVVLFTTVLSIMLERLSKKEKYHWIKYLYS